MSEDLILETREDRRYAPSSAAPLPVVIDSELQQDLSKIPDKMAFKIGEVADLVGVKSYVLRYWESEFESLRPKKSKHNQRVYERKDLEQLMLIKKLLYRDRYSIEGARAAIKKMKRTTQTVRQIKSFADQMEDLKLRAEDLVEGIGRLRSRLAP